ncbi:TonB-dependent receptor [Undibacterium sp. MH2W]|uniref:TonB-dependent receptor n=1 Tax=Undibacterium sp. MH2W TaxID=3413044 RepID=UPI003BF25954
MSKKEKIRDDAALNFQFKVTPIAAACVIMLSISANNASAQQATPAAGNSTVTSTVEVVGIRKGIEDAISVKKENTSIVEAISAEDIGKLPDTTIAESLARLPGLTTQRDKNGNATTISIRGLSPDFAGYLLNGREQTSTADSRAVDLSVYPAELISGAVVYKTNDAEVVGQGLSGTIDQKLIDPLAFPKRTVSVGVQQTKNGVSLQVQGTGKRETFTYIDQFADRTIGVALGVVHQTSDSGHNDFGTWGDYKGNVVDTNGNTVSGVTVPGGGGFNIDTQTVSDKRTGVAGILAFKPNKNFNSQLDVFYSKIEDYTKISELQIPGTGAFTKTTIVGGVATGTTMTGVNLIDRNEGLLENDTIKSVGWKNTLKVNNDWTAVVDLSYNSAQSVQRDDEYYAGLATPQTLTMNGLNGGVPQMAYGASLTDPSTMAIRNQCGWSGISSPLVPQDPSCSSVSQAGYAKGPTITDKVKAVRVDLKKEFSEGMFTNLKFGLNYTDRTKTAITDEGLIISAAQNGYARVPMPSGASVISNVGGTGINMLGFDPTVDLVPGTVLQRKYNNDILSKTWGVEEKVTTVYGKLDLESKVANIPVRGNVGLQIVNTTQSGSGYQASVGSTPVLNNPAVGGSMTTEQTSYTNVLPSLNLNGDLGNDLALRLGLARQIARPNMTDMRGSFSFAVNSNPAAVNGVAQPARFEGSAGNPFLKPFLADAFDVSLEKYFAKKGYISAAAFYKKLDTYIVPMTNSSFDYTPYLSTFGLQSLPGGNKGIYTTTVNGSGGALYGTELTASVPLNMASKYLDGFGVTASYSYTDSDVSLPNSIGQNPDQAPNAGSIPLPGLSKVNEKLMVYFEKNGFSAFVATNMRSKYVGSVGNTTVGGYPSLMYIQPQRWVSAQIGYEIQSGPVKGLSVRFEGNNLNHPFYQLNNGDGSVNTKTQTGATYFLSLSYKL